VRKKKKKRRKEKEKKSHLQNLKNVISDVEIQERGEEDLEVDVVHIFKNQGRRLGLNQERRRKRRRKKKKKEKEKEKLRIKILRDREQFW